ncbi:MAG: hypothetical protein KME31_19820 [Tolypothrix carrinoi HA7290-LM1]|jgi:hypothetical protein|nr:hypothetical protein [Tolypothrix carrinoi HA7290-LM1]
MKNNIKYATIIYILTIALSGCTAIDDIFKAGSKNADTLVQQGSRNADTVVQQGSINAIKNRLDQKCLQQFRKSRRAELVRDLFNGQSSEDYLIRATRDALQKCILGKVADSILDKLVQEEIETAKTEYKPHL